MDDTDIDNDDMSFLDSPSPLYRNSDSSGRDTGVSTWQDAILTELTKQAPVSPAAASLLDAIEELAESLSSPHSTSMNPGSLSALICGVLDRQRGSGIELLLSETLVSDSITIIAMQSTRWLLRHLMDYYLDILLGIWPDIQFWKGRLRVRKPLRDLLEQGPLNWFRPFFGFIGNQNRPISPVQYRHRPDYPHLILRSFRTGIKPLISNVNLSGRIDIQEKVGRLCDLKKILLNRAGLLHHHSFRLSRTQSPSLEEWLGSILDLYRICVEDEPPEGRTATDALSMLNDILVALPEMDRRFTISRNELRRPGHFQRHWLAYTISGFAAMYACRKIYVHQTKLGSLVRSGVKCSHDFWLEHVSIPVRAIHKRLVRPRLPQLKRGEVLQERRTLEVMLREFGTEQIERNPKLIPPGMSKERFIEVIKQRAAVGEMTMVLDSYRSEVAKPIYALAAGDLLRCILIQLQKLKVDLEGSLLELDDMLEQNEITLELAAIVPAILMAVPIILLILYPASKRIKADTTSHRVIKRSVQSIHRLLICNYTSQTAAGYETIQDSGKILTHVHQIGKRAIHLRGQKFMPHSAFLLLRKDIKRLVSLDFTIEQKRQLVKRMYNVHPFLAM
uniref:Uncharacterized protein n=1 Tax=Spongospora subterranea TaxID=70186 RepID=A0A0H5RA29_9EUKA|eukprot:CRZ10532.1 hypothetical protein [Spongospora subterranea]